MEQSICSRLPHPCRTSLSCVPISGATLLKVPFDTMERLQSRDWIRASLYSNGLGHLWHMVGDPVFPYLQIKDLNSATTGFTTYGRYS